MRGVARNPLSCTSTSSHTHPSPCGPARQQRKRVLAHLSTAVLSAQLHTSWKSCVLLALLRAPSRPHSPCKCPYPMSFCTWDTGEHGTASNCACVVSTVLVHACHSRTGILESSLSGLPSKFQHPSSNSPRVSAQEPACKKQCAVGHPRSRGCSRALSLGACSAWSPVPDAKG